MSLIEVKGLRKSFGSLEVLKGVDLTVEQGERIAIIGGSGCGKSVFLRSLCLLEKLAPLAKAPANNSALPPLRTFPTRIMIRFIR